MHKAYFTQDFRKHLEKLTRRDSVLKERIASKIDDMMNDPIRNSEELVGAFKGKRRAYVGKAGHRLIFGVCKECREKNYQDFNSCFECASKDISAVIFFDVIHRSEGYRNH